VVTQFTHQIREGVVDLDHFLTAHYPDVIVYDIAPPYDANGALFQHLRTLPAMKDRKIVLTSVNRRHVERLTVRPSR